MREEKRSSGTFSFNFLHLVAGMPPRARAAARTKETGPPPIHTDTIQLGPSQSIGTVLQHQLFFNSEQWITPLYRDINALLSSFEHEWLEELGRQISALREPRVVQDEQPHQSPFEVFKRLWRDKGWSFVHLLGVADGPLREPWGESVLRGFAGTIRSPFNSTEPGTAEMTSWACSSR